MGLRGLVPILLWPLATLKQASPSIMCRAGLAHGGLCDDGYLPVPRCARTLLGVSPKRERNQTVEVRDVGSRVECNVGNPALIVVRFGQQREGPLQPQLIHRPVNVVPVEAISR